MKDKPLDLKEAFANTVATYAGEAGAAAYIAKERVFEAERNAKAYASLEDLPMAGWRVLDVGCGFGRDVAEFHRRGAEAYGCDLSGPLLRQAEGEVGSYFASHDLRSPEPLPFGGGFDMVWCCSVLVHIPREELGWVLGKMWDALKPGGWLVLITKSGEGETIVRNLDGPRIMVYFTAQEIAKVLKIRGGTIETATDTYSTTAYGEKMLLVRMRKP